MRVAIVAGPPSTGKTSVVVQALRLLPPGLKVGGGKFDCLASEDAATYGRAGAIARSVFSAGQCPDHFFATNVPAAFDWAQQAGCDLRDISWKHDKNKRFVIADFSG